MLPTPGFDRQERTQTLARHEGGIAHGGIEMGFRSLGARQQRIKRDRDAVGMLIESLFEILHWPCLSCPDCPVPRVAPLPARTRLHA